MSQLFSRNAYSVLGLDTSVSQKEISKRSKEIVKLLKIDEIPEYDTDLKSINNIVRDEAAVNDAAQRLSSPIKRIQEYFFWFEVENDQDEKNLELLRDDQYNEALDNWQQRAEKSLTAKRNLAIASSILLNHTGYKKHLKLSVEAWDDVVNSDKFWSHFEKVYALNDEVGTSKSAIDGFRGKVLDYLSDFYTDVSRRKKDNSIYAAFGSTFGTKGKKVQDEVLTPIFEQINSASEQLRQLNASQDNRLSSQESMTIKRLVRKIQDLFQEIKDLGLYDDSHSKVMRDKAAEAINIVAVDLFNNLDEDAKSAALIKIAKSFAAGPAVISRINKNVEYIKQVTSHGKIIDPINALIDEEQYQKALELINQEKSKHKNDKTLQVYFAKRTQWCVTGLAMHDFKEAKRLFEAKDFIEAESWFNSTYDFIYSYIEDFDINKEALDDVLATLRNKLLGLNANTLSDVDSYREQVIANSNFDKETNLELPIITMLLDSAIYQRMAQLIPELKKKGVKRAPILFTLNGCGTKIYGDTLYLTLLFIPILPLSSYDLKETNDGQFSFYGKRPLTTPKKWWKWGLLSITAIIIIFSMGSNDSTNTSPGVGSSSSSNRSSNSAWQICSDEYDSLKGQLDSVEGTMNSYNASRNVDAYNALVPRQNSLVQQVNNKAAECNNLR